MHTKCQYHSASRTLDDNLIISFTVDEDVIEELNALQGIDLVMDIEKFRQKRSLNANAYLWVLCQKIAEVLGSDKDSIYLWLLGKYGVFVDNTVKKEAIPLLQRQFKYTEDMDDNYLTEHLELHTIRCYLGSSTYDSKEMSTLINGAVLEAKNIGISTWSDEEIDYLIKNWKG